MPSRRLSALAFALSAAVSVHGQSPEWGQCGGTGWTGSTTCVAGTVCTEYSSSYSQCVPSTTTVTPTSTAPVSTPSITPVSGNTLTYTGVNIAGFDFGCGSDGTCNPTGAWPPLTQYYGMDGAGQMQHFTSTDGYNVFRLPVGWQFLTNGVLGGDLDAANLAEYDALVQTCLATGASCIIDIHNYARWNGLIIGQGGPTNDQFAALWTSIATKYADEENIIFGVMNEPHDIPDINLWAGSVQAAVTAIRNAGATKQLILLPGNNWTSAETFVSNGSGPALLTVTNPDGSTTGLIFDVHKYLDSDNSGTNEECVTNNIDSSWAPLATWLRENGRQAFNTETGGGNVASCVEYMCQQIAFQAQNSDVFLGYVGWAAGNFYPTYVLGEAPTQSGTTWTDTLLVASCMAPIAGAQAGSTGE
ncbi:endoglucanase [Lentinula guzmanii]|uniref:cellulase n=3 Tax=Lentinula TaxID=5352 RepID=A0AA38N351_9AGAR|nr:endoglucanase [Lentinula guzmanii]KAJ3748009.1 endoglucanase [Lentinula detonsa]KAJ3783903.1 endoglucanase [Lentinula aff. detonsa]KAJ3793671.1 endoglucanase [Lentinula aff. detonsa]